jgi:6-phosphogluconolactonase (cycloisomerase 2 family)
MNQLLLSALLALGACASVAPPPARAQQLFLATADGTARVLDLEHGSPAAVAARLETGEELAFLALHPALPVVYALGRERLHALAWDASRRSLTPLGALALGVRGTHLALDAAGRFAIVASYGDNAVVLVALDDRGVPGEVAQTLGGARDATFTKAHQVRVHPGTGAVHVPCLGSDHVATLALDARAGRLVLLSTARTPDGAGPRHLAYHPTLPRAYVLNERASSVTAFAVDAASGALSALETTSTRPPGSDEGSRSSDVHVAPDGRFLFAVNREPLNDIVTFAIAADGTLAPRARASTGGDHARTFAVDPAGEHLWIANTRSQELTSFRIGRDGALTRLPGAWPVDALLNCVLAR